MKIALIGCGKQAQKHLKGFIANKIKNFILYDPIVERARHLATEFNCEFTDSLDSLFLDDTISAIDICTPVEFHKELSIRAIIARKHFFCEKPLTISARDDEEITSLANQYSVVGMVGYIYRFVPVLLEVKDILSKNILGEIHFAFFKIGAKGNHAIWKHLRHSNGGVLNEMAVHMIDLIIWYFGNVSQVQLLDAEICLPLRVIEGQTILSDTEDFLLAKLRAAQGTQILLMADFLSSDFNQYLELQGSNGSLKASIQPNFPHELNLFKRKGIYPKGQTKLSYNTDDLYITQMQYFIDLIQSKKLDNYSLQESYKVMQIHNYLRDEILNKINISASSNYKPHKYDPITH